MDDSAINPLLLTSSAHLENVEQLIKNLEKQTLDLDNFDNILSTRHRQEIITKSFSSVSSSTMAIDDAPEDNFLLKSISLTNPSAKTRPDDNLSMDSLFNQRDLFENDEAKKQQTPPGNDQSLLMDQDAGFTWDDQYDTRANYRLTFSTDKQQQQPESKRDKTHRHKHHHHHHHHRHKHRTTDAQSSSMYSDDGLPPTVTSNMNDWSMRSSVNALEQSEEQPADNKPLDAQQQTAFIRSQSHPTSFSSQQQPPANANNNTSPNSSTTTSSSSSASWRRMKESQRTTSGMETKEARPPSPLSLYKIFQQKSQMAASSPRSAFQYYRQPNDAVVPTLGDSMTISGEKLKGDKPKPSYYQRKANSSDRRSSQSNSSTDQAIQTSIYVGPSSNSQMNSHSQALTGPASKSGSYDQLSSHTASNSSQHLTIPSRPSPAPIASSTFHKSLPDLAFISQYSKEIPRSRAASPLPPASANTTPSPTMTQQQKQESERPRTLKSIKRYKNSKHSTEPLGVFYSPQLRKTFAAVPASAIAGGTSESPTIMKMKMPPSFSSHQIGQQQQQQSNANLKSCLKYGSRASSCDIQAMLQDRNSPAPPLTIPEPASNQGAMSPSWKRRNSDTDTPPKPTDNFWPSNAYNAGSSGDLDSYLPQDMARDHRSDHDLAFLLQQQQTKKSVSFSENIAKQLISPCHPAIKLDLAPEYMDDDDVDDRTRARASDLAVALHGKNDRSTRKPTSRYGEMRRCQTDIIVVDRVHHLHSFTESPPNEFRLQETDSLAPDVDDEDDQTIMEKMPVNIIPKLDEVVPITVTQGAPPGGKVMSSNDKENVVPMQLSTMSASTTTLIPTNDPSLDGLLERTGAVVKSIFDVKRSEKAFFLTNEPNTRLDTLLNTDLCSILQSILEHGLQSPRKDPPGTKQINLWRIIETSIEHGPSLQAFHDAKQIAQNASTYWLYKFQAFIFALLNKNELINWLYHYMKQKDVLQRYYRSPDALVLVQTPATFNLFDRIMAQLEKLSPLAFRLTYRPAPIPFDIDEQLNMSTISIHSTKASPREWVMNISRRASRTSTQPIVQPTMTPANPAPSTDTMRSTLTRKLNSLFTKTNPAPPQRKVSSAVTARLPAPKAQTMRSASPAVNTRPRLSNVFANATTTANTTRPVIVASSNAHNGTRSGSMRRAISPSVAIAPTPPSAPNSSATANSTFQSKIPRPSLNVDKPKSARYRSTAAPPK